MGDDVRMAWVWDGLRWICWFNVRLDNPTVIYCNETLSLLLSEWYYMPVTQGGMVSHPRKEMVLHLLTILW